MARLSVGLACSVVAGFCLTFVIGSTQDEEEFRFAVLSTWLHVDALRHGRFEFWTALLGLGVPQPFMPNFLLHPLSPLLAVLSPVTWIRVQFWAARAVFLCRSRESLIRRSGSSGPLGVTVAAVRERRLVGATKRERRAIP